MTDDSQLFSQDEEESSSINTETLTCEPLSEFVRWTIENIMSSDKVRKLTENEQKRQQQDAQPKYDKKRFLGRQVFDYTKYERDAKKGNPIRVRTCDLKHIDNNHRKCNDDDSHASSDWEKWTGIKWVLKPTHKNLYGYIDQTP